MILAQMISSYLTLNLLLGIGFVGVLAAHGALTGIKSKTELQLNYLSISLVFFVTGLFLLLPKPLFFQPAIKIWSAPSIKAFAHDVASERGGYFALADHAVGTMTTQGFESVWLLAVVLALSFSVYRLCSDLRRLHQIRKGSYTVKKIGRVSILANDHVAVPFSYAFLGQARVVVPSSFLAQHQDYRIALAHEIQHHRQGDTSWVYVSWLVRLVCAPNPVSYLWSRHLSEIQEFACDETLLGRNKVKPQAYVRCLVEVAQTTINQERMPVCATGLTFLGDRNLLSRRIKRMLETKQRPHGQKIKFAAVAGLTAMMTMTAYAAKDIVQDRRVTMDQAKAMVKNVASSDFPIVVNDAVLRQLNRYLGTPDGREFMRASLARMTTYQTAFSAKLEHYQVPASLIAIPIVESGYQNLPESNQVGYGAGVWMFIKKTAQNYGLKVDGQIDERLQTDLETDAAMRLLISDHLRFQSWPLAVLAYNAGENMVQNGVNATGSTEAWTLIKAGYEGDKDYLARVTAAVIIMHNPLSIQ